MSRRLVLLASALALLACAAGCWDRVEIQKRAFVTGVGIDLAEDGPSPDDRFVVTLEIPKLGSTAQGQPSGQGGGGTPQAQTTWLLSASGPSIFTTIREMATRSNLSLFVGHNRLLIVGEEAAKQELRSICDIFDRETEFTRRFRVLVSREEAKKVFEIAPQTADVVSSYIYDILERTQKTSRFIERSFGRMIMDLRETGNCLLPRVVAGKTDVKVAGTAVIRDWRMVGWLGEEETQALAMLLGEAGGGTVRVSDFPHQGSQLTLEVLAVRPQVTPQVSGDQVSFQVRLKVDGRVTEADRQAPALVPRLIPQAEKAAAAEIRRSLMAMIGKLQHEFGADILHFGWRLQKELPQAWEHLRGRWNQEFKEADVHVEVEVRIRGFGEVG